MFRVLLAVEMSKVRVFVGYHSIKKGTVILLDVRDVNIPAYNATDLGPGVSKALKPKP